MSLRDRLLPVVQRIRRIPDNFGLRRYAVTIERRAWTGGKPGEGTPRVTPLELAPRPRVRVISAAEVAASGGTYQEGDFRVDRITPTFADQGGGGFGPGELRLAVLQLSQDLAVVLDGDEGRLEATLVSAKFDRAFGYSLVVRQRRRAV